MLIAWIIYSNYLSHNLNEQSQRRPETNYAHQMEGVTDKEKVEDISPEEVLAASPKLQKRKQMQQAANREMNFYGKVIDQYGDPVPGAQIEYSYAYYPDLILPTFSWAIRQEKTSSNANGMFQITGKNGVHLTVKQLEHPDYIIRSHNTFQFRPRSVGDMPFTSDPANPVIFHAWKKDYAARELKEGKDYWAYRTDGEYYKVPMDGLEDGLQVHFELLGNNGSTDMPRQWRATLKLDRGGLVETTDTFLYEAPESGYQSVWKIVASENDRIERKFYFKAKNGRIHGHISMTLRGYYGDTEEIRNKGFIDYEYALNPTGSRNLLPADE